MQNPDAINRKEISNLSKFTLDHGGDISYLKIPSKESEGDGLTNGSILRHNDKWYLNLRRVGYLLYHSENKQELVSPWGPLVYLNPEDDVVLRTHNYICQLNDEFEIEEWAKVNTDLLDEKPLWTFIGLEDARLQNWDGVLTQSGVRRDTTTNGEGRMEISTIERSGCCNFDEIDRVRISPPDPRTHAEGGSYCEKNWMPINDLPYHYIKWSNPTEVVKVNKEEGTSETVKLVEQPHIKTKRDMRGSSNVVKYGDYWVAIIHEVDLWFNNEEKKDSIYYHRFVVWDKDWNIKYISKELDFMTARIEFTCGLAFDGKDFLIPFGFQDSTSFLLRMPSDVFEYITNMTEVEPMPRKVYKFDKRPQLYNFVNNPHDPKAAWDLAEKYYAEGHSASALSFYLRAGEWTNDKDFRYNSFFMACRCVADKGRRDVCERRMWLRLIDLDPHRPEGYMHTSNYHSWRGEFHEAYFICSMALKMVNREPSIIGQHYDPTNMNYDFNLLKDLWGGSYGKYKEKLAVLHDYKNGFRKDWYPSNLYYWLDKESDKYKLTDPKQ